ncbi:MAG TPA: sugar phosphate nucleotidyltransferase, partial [Acidimicrobiales bacterium]
AGRRLAPLTRLRPKALCPVGGRPLVDLALDRLRPVTRALAVNVHAGREAMEAHLDGRAHVSVEEPEALGTAGALGRLRPWIDGRPTIVANADAWLADDVASLTDGWDGERMRLLCVRDPARGDFGDLRYCGLALLPWSVVGALAEEPSGLYEVAWRAAAVVGVLDLVVHPGAFVDCGTPADYLEANLASSGGASVVAPAATVGAGAVVERSVVWPGSVVAPGEVLVDAVRAGPLTVLVR